MCRLNGRPTVAEAATTCASGLFWIRRRKIFAAGRSRRCFFCSASA